MKNALAAAIEVLSHSDEPLSKQEIARRAIDSGIWQSTGKTPYETIGSQIYTDIKKNGDQSLFVLVERGVFTLRNHPHLPPLSSTDHAPVTDNAPAETTDTPVPAPAAMEPAAPAEPAPAEATTPAAPAEATTPAAPAEATTPAATAEATTPAATGNNELAVVPDVEPISFVDCAYVILSNFADQKPLSSRDIARLAIDNGLLNATVPLAADTIAASLREEINRAASQGEEPRFLRDDDGRFALASWNPDPQVPAENREEAPAETPAEQPADQTPLTLTDCACKVLEEMANGKPMHYRTITAKALNAGWLVSSSKTPEVSLYAQVITEIKQRLRKNEPQRFQRFKNGFIGLTAWNENTIAYQIHLNNQNVADEAIQRLQKLPADSFEAFLTRFLTEIGFEDLTLYPDHENSAITAMGTLIAAGVVKTPMIVLFLRWAKTVDVNTLRPFLASLNPGERAIVITTSNFSPAAEALAAENTATLALMNAAQLAAQLAEHAVGIRKINTSFLEIDNDELPAG